MRTATSLTVTASTILQTIPNGNTITVDQTLSFADQLAPAARCLLVVKASEDNAAVVAAESEGIRQDHFNVGSSWFTDDNVKSDVGVDLGGAGRRRN